MRESLIEWALFLCSGFEVVMQGIGNKTAVIFDLDGVLVDTSEFHRQSWFDLAEKEGYDMSDELFYSTFGMQNYQILPLLAGGELSAERVDEMGKWKEHRYRELMGNELQAMEGAEGLVAELKGSGFLLAIGTSTPRENLEAILVHTRYSDYFDAYVTGEDVINGKPAPDTFLKAAEKLGAEPSECVVVEDAIPGVAAAKNAGMMVAAVTSTRKREELHRADIVVDSLGELKANDFVRLLTSAVDQ
jgi:beta-phosphoglucomutase